MQWKVASRKIFLTNGQTAKRHGAVKRALQSPQGDGSEPTASPRGHEQWPRTWGTLFCVVMFFASLVAAIMLWKAIGGKHPYAFYTALRWVCFSVFFCSAIATFRVTREYGEAWFMPTIFGAVLGALAVLRLFLRSYWNILACFAPILTN